MKVILTIILLYISTSLMEWYVHKYMLHDENNKLTKIINSFISKIYSKIHGIEQPDNHINHHTITHNDNKVYTEDDGILYSGYNIPFTTLLGFLIYFVLCKIIRYNHTNKEYMIIFISWIFISSSYYFLWNVLHPTYHEYKYSKNYESIKTNFIYKYLEKYHMIHHYNKGNNKCNFNIILPGIDFLFGTYKRCVDNSEFCKNKDKNEMNEKEKELCGKQELNIKLHPDIDYCSSNDLINE